MATVDSNPVPFAEDVTTHCCGWARAYEGSPDALLAAVRAEALGDA